MVNLITTGSIKMPQPCTVNNEKEGIGENTKNKEIEETKKNREDKQRK